MQNRKVKVAAIQASPVLPMDKRATADKACALIDAARAEKADLIVFPETFLPMFPVFSTDLNRQNEWCRELKELTEQSVYLEGDEIARIAAAAKAAKAFVAMGVSEREGDANLYNTQVFIGPDGAVLGRRRKLFPSNREKAIWSPGGGRDILVLDTPIGRIGGLICYEHLQPLLKFAMMSQGEQIHCASWPGWPHFEGIRSNRHVIDASARQYALEGQCFVIVASLYVPKECVPPGAEGAWAFFGGSGIVAPNGEYLAGPLYDGEGIVYAEIDLTDILMRKTLIDTAGRDRRGELFKFSWNGKE